MGHYLYDMAKITAFDWDTLQITKDEDPAYAGDKVPDSEDDIPCGDGFIPRSKDCHDGGAHRPEKGENPYWTDDNSADKRTARDVHWGDNKPSKPSERVTPDTPEDEVYEDPEEDMLEDDEDPLRHTREALWKVPEGQWAKNQKGLRDSLIQMATLHANIDISSDEVTSLTEAASALDPDTGTEVREDIMEIADLLEKSLQGAQELMDKHRKTLFQIDMLSTYEEKIMQGLFAVDSIRGSVEPDDPREIQAWDKLRNRPETLEVADLLALANIRGGEDPSYMPDTMANLASTLEKWRESPMVGGDYLASLFYKEPKATRTSGTFYESLFETNPKVALAILDRSARAGDHGANRAMWKDFGLSEEWHPTSFLFDNQKAIEKGTRELEQMADWEPLREAQREQISAEYNRVKAEDAVDASNVRMVPLMEALADKRETGEITEEEFLEAVSQVQYKHADFEDAIWTAHDATNRAIRNVRNAAAEIRGQVTDSLKKLNAYSQPDSELVGKILHSAGNPTWADIREDSDEYKARPGMGRGGLSGQRLLTLRKRNRDKDPQFANAGEIQANLQDFLSMTHKDLLGHPAMKDLTWHSEIFERAHAIADGYSITLSTHPRELPKGNVYTKAAETVAFSRPDVAIHEFAHHLEVKNPDVHGRMVDFYNHRTKGENFIKNSQHRALSHYGAEEMFKEDKFYDMYCGKSYGEAGHALGMGKDWLPPTELLTMGVQALYNENQWSQLVRNDREHLALIIATMRGY